MKRVVLSFLSCILATFGALGSHIVGGEFELLHVQDFQYRLNMILYFDAIFGNPGALDNQVTVDIYRKSDDQRIRTVTLPLIQTSDVLYSNPACTDDSVLETDRIFYSATIQLSPSLYDDPEGYYISWQRCCRNYQITNAVSNPPDAGVFAGQTFYLEFPPVTKDGNPFINSTPRLFPPLSDFACANVFYFADFGGTDDDGDSLVYSLVNPLSTITGDALPPPSSGPYPDIIWETGFDLDNVVGGDPDLVISKDGLLTVTPTNRGIYVFAVKVEEFRNGIKHGEMRRDFQLVVTAGCFENNAPEVRAREEGESAFYNEGTVLNFDFDDDDKCIELLVTDLLKNPGGADEDNPDSVSNINLRAIPINFDADLDDIIDTGQDITIRSNTDTARFTVCFPSCPFVRSGFYQIGLIGLDDACPQPALDTIVVSVNVEPPPNQNAFFKVDDVNRSGSVSFLNQVSAGGSQEITVGSFDNDNDSVSLSVTPLGFEFSDIGIQVDDIAYAPGEAVTRLVWNFDCQDDILNLDFSAGRDVPTASGVTKAFDILLEAEDFDQCEWEDPQSLLVTLLINDPEQSKPIIFESNNPNQDSLQFDYLLRQTARHTIRGFDQDQDIIKLTALGINFQFESVDFVFPEAEAVENVVSDVLWDIACSIDLETQDSLRVQFFVEDVDACQFTNTDTLTVDFLLGPPPSRKPELDFSSLNTVEFEEDSASIIVGNSVNLRLTGREFESDSLELVLVSEPPSGLQFENVRGLNVVNSDLIWDIDCSVFTDNNFEENITLDFVLFDENCFLPLTDTLSIKVNVKDIPQRNEFAITNVITPKTSPDQNDYFGYYTIENPSEEDRLIYLPVDNCAGQFEEVIIHNRWGQTVFSSTNRDFKWFANDVAAGIYYYTILYSNSKYQGPLTVLF
ncbi:MAG: hypothetical protein AAF519_06675 [Bacteroidota bacterium]